MNGLLFALLASPWGMALGLHPPAAERISFDTRNALFEIRSLGANAVLLPVPWTTTDLETGDLFRTEETISDGELVETIRVARAEGLDVALMPFVVVAHPDEHAWRGVLAPRHPERWWKRYRATIVHYARIAEREHVETLVIGSELTSLQDDATAWRALSDTVRAHYSGRTAYVANHDALDRLAPFAFVDVAGVSAYFPLTDDLDATAADLEAGWARAARRLERFAREVERPVVLFEVGYPSIDGAATRPWDDTIGAPIDLEEQRRAYEAVTSNLLTTDAIAGAYFWTWFGPGGPLDRTYSPRDKPAELVLARFFALRARSQPAASAMPAMNTRPE